MKIFTKTFSLLVIHLALVALFLTAGTLTVTAQTQDAILLTHSGNVSGHWDITLSPITITGDILVPNGAQLIIDPGVEINFLGNYIFKVEGLLIAEGAAEPNGKIRFNREDGGLWQGIQFYNADNRSRIIRCEILNARTGIDLNRTSPSIRYNRIIAQSVGISCIASSPDISNNYKISAGMNSAQSTCFGIKLFDGSNAQISNNERIEAIGTFGVEFIGILVDRSFPSIRENWVEVVSQTTSYGIVIRRADKVSLIKNIVRVRSPQSMTALWTVDTEELLVRNNNFILNESCFDAFGIIIDTGTRATLQNNIVFGNGSSVGIKSDRGTIQNGSGYNNLYQHETYYTGRWEGNNDIYIDPKFVAHQVNHNNVDTSSYKLRWDDFLDEGERFKSPCIDAGDPAFNDPDGTVSDIGRFHFNQRKPDSVDDLDELYPNRHTLIKTFPNPFNGMLQINVNLVEMGYTNIAMYDILGNLVEVVYSGVSEKQSMTISWTPSMHLSAGTYLVKLENNGKSYLQKVIYIP